MRFDLSEVQQIAYRPRKLYRYAFIVMGLLFGVSTSTIIAMQIANGELVVASWAGILVMSTAAGVTLACLIASETGRMGPDTVIVDDEGVRLIRASTKVVARRWRDPKFSMSIVMWVKRPAAAEKLPPIETRFGLSWAALTQEALDCILEVARSQGIRKTVRSKDPTWWDTLAYTEIFLNGTCSGGSQYSGPSLDIQLPP